MTRKAARLVAEPDKKGHKTCCLDPILFAAWWPLKGPADLDVVSTLYSYVTVKVLEHRGL